MTVSTIILLVIVGLAAGILSGLVGVGGGIIMVPLFVFALGLTQHNAQGLSLAVMLPPVTIFAVYNYHTAGDGNNINWWAATLVAVLFVLGGYLGSKLALQIDQRTLKKIFGGFMLLVALKLIFTK
ncbi:sulfite exporter TauE/SafE family protein [Lutibacter sp. HS1-25]|uniref:sulfite exporter TauE/SafE family protein n=1 Tax=Lutibacter sp. HS1-25 TaxID=2485000 RepID=UPI00101201B7|nr:sulfite exporter TauE/SafE family protein [Lutibacter sp. HS1-25]RXP53234.1 sulfite exporter TauE/SafE family protein [Lutibacter sp. HS1-25]